MSNLKQTYYSFIDDVVINTHNTIYTNDHRNVTKINELVNLNDSNYFTKNIEHTSSLTDTITMHNHYKYEHDVITHVHKLITHTNNYDTATNCDNDKPFDTNNYFNFYHDMSKLITNEPISNYQQTDITTNVIETNTQIKHYIDET